MPGEPCKTLSDENERLVQKTQYQQNKGVEQNYLSSALQGLNCDFLNFHLFYIEVANRVTVSQVIKLIYQNSGPAENWKSKRCDKAFLAIWQSRETIVILQLSESQFIPKPVEWESWPAFILLIPHKACCAWTVATSPVSSLCGSDGRALE